MKEQQLIQSVCTKSVKRLLTVLLSLTFAMSLSAADVEGDTLVVRFRVGQSDIDLSYANNEQRINNFVTLVREHHAELPKNGLKLDIYTGASPEGPSELNRRLGEQRGIALKEVLMKRLGDMIEEVTVINQGARWGGLYKMIEESNEPWKGEVLYILSKTPEGDEWVMEPREQELRKLHKGAVWRQLQDKYLTKLRSSGSAVVIPRTEPRRDTVTVLIRDTIIYLPEPCPVYEEPIDHTPVWALKTNLLLWGVVAPNVQIEIPLGKNRWSLEGEVFWPWWIWSHSSRAEQFGNVGLELKYWLGNREKHHTLDGWHLGLGVAAGYYDFEWKQHKGYQGEYLSGYLNLGYQHRFGRRKQWAIDAGIGVGCIPTKYRKYYGSSVFPKGYEEEEDHHLMWQKTTQKIYFGATHANVSIAYIFHTKKKDNVVSETLMTVPVATKNTAAEPVKLSREELKALKKGKSVKVVDQSTPNEAKALKEQTRAAEKEAKAQAKAAENNAKAQAIADKQNAKLAAKEAKAQAKLAEENAKAQAIADKQNAKLADAKAKAQAKNAEQQAKEQAKLEEAKAKAQAKIAEKQAKEQAEEAEAQAKAQAKLAEVRAKEADAKAKEMAKIAEKEAKEADAKAKAMAKAAEKEAKEADAKAKEMAKIAEQEAKEQAKLAEKEAKAQAKEAEQKAKEQALAEKNNAKAQAQADKERQKELKEEAKAVAKAEKETQKALEKEAKAAAKNAK